MGLFEFTKIKLGLIAETNYSFALQKSKNGYTETFVVVIFIQHRH